MFNSSSFQMLLSFLILLTLFGVCSAYAEQLLLQQPHINPPKNSQFRDLIWGDINFLHTTDTHGWYAGHLNQRQYSADWGDFISFTNNLKSIAKERAVDLLLIDTGDKYDGNGLSDATEPMGAVSNKIFNQQDYDLITLGNHELYDESKSVQEYETNVAKFGDHYVSSNVEFLNSNNEWVSFGSKYRYFTTSQQNKRVLALSFLFDFKRFNKRIRVTPSQKSIQELWFKELIEEYPEEKIDILIIFGHLPITDIQSREINILHAHLRSIYPNIVIQYFGGHSHIRDFVRFDYLSTGLQSGRYCETVGWLSFNSTDNQFHRRYIDFNKESFKYHSNIEEEEVFDTIQGLELSKFIYEQRIALNLTYNYGYVPNSYLMNQYPQGHEHNIYYFLNSTIIPTLNKDRTNNRIIIINTGSIRYDLYKGNFTRDTEFIVSPFKNNWNYISLENSLAFKIELFLNNQDYILSIPETLSTYRANCPFVDEKSLKKGLTTHDDFGCNGDDVRHNSISYHHSPNVIQTYQEFNRNYDDGRIDLVFYDFLKPNIIYALNQLDHKNTYTNENFKLYKGESVGELLRNYVIENWS